MTLTKFTIAMLALAGALVSAPAVAEIPDGSKTVSIVDTKKPGGFLGYWGFDLFQDQSAAERFTVPADGDYRLHRVGIWLMNNSDTEQQAFTISIQTDAKDEGGDQSIPSGHKLLTWQDTVQTYGWTPVQQFFVSPHGPRLLAGHRYWVVAESTSPAFVDPVWVMSGRGRMVNTTTMNGQWQVPGKGAALTLRIDVQPLTTP